MGQIETEPVVSTTYAIISNIFTKSTASSHILNLKCRVRTGITWMRSFQHDVNIFGVAHIFRSPPAANLTVSVLILPLEDQLQCLSLSVCL